jgi:signal peptidase I
LGAEEEQVSRRWLDLIGVVIGALLLALLIQWVLVKPYRIPSGSMLPTLVQGQRVFVDRLSNRFSDPKLGQIVVFHPPKGAARADGQDTCGVPRPPGQICPTAERGEDDLAFIKRVVGLPGDRIALRRGQVIRNGVPADEPYAQRCNEEICNLAEFTVPADSLLMLGDNRDDSNDSRYWGAIPRRNVVGRAFATYWPKDRIGGL